MDLNGNGARGTGFALLDVASCRSGECAVTPLPGFPDVAPGGEHVLTIDFAGGREESLGLSTTAAPAEIRWLPRSRWAFWIDAHRFASINWDGTVQVGTVDNPAQRRTVVTAAEIVEALPEEVRPPSGRAEISDGFANPTDPDQIYLFLAPDRGLSSRSTLLLVRYDVASGAVTLVDTPQRTSHFPHFSPDGRWLVLWSEAQGRGRFRQESKLTILDTEAPDAQPVELAGDTTVNVQWLPEGQQLLINHGRFARLHAPESGRTALFALPDGVRCQQTFWRARPVE
jgi:dipeptidyl aminopeptidase/acylaminoacyl peptidase